MNDRCEFCGASEPRHSITLPYARFPSGRLSTPAKLRSAQIGIIDSQICHNCWLRLTRGDLVALILGLTVGLGIGAFEHPNWVPWLLLLGVLLSIGLACLYSRTSQSRRTIEKSLFAHLKLSLSARHGVPPNELRAIWSHWR